MFRRIHQQSGSAALVVAICALVVAAAGTAYAAVKLNSAQKKEVKAIAKKFAGQDGAPGKEGTQGPKGDPGPKGDLGPKGEKGIQGDLGSDGKSPEGFAFTGGSEPVGNPCAGTGGIEYEVEGSGEPHYLCNGKDGSPWTAGGTLPPGSTESGAWAVAATTADTNGVRIPLSFPVRLSAGVAATNVHFQTEATFSDFDGAGAGTLGCGGTAAAPAVPSGHLCVYVNPGDVAEISPGVFGIPNVPFDGIYKPTSSGKGSSAQGAILQFSVPTGEGAARGTFAITG